MDLDQVKKLLQDCVDGLQVVDEKRLPDDHGAQLILKNGAVVNVFDTGKTSVQGKGIGVEMLKLLVSNRQNGLATPAVLVRNDSSPPVQRVHPVHRPCARAVPTPRVSQVLPSRRLPPCAVADEREKTNTGSAVTPSD